MLSLHLRSLAKKCRLPEITCVCLPSKRCFRLFGFTTFLSKCPPRSLMSSISRPPPSSPLIIDPLARRCTVIPFLSVYCQSLHIFRKDRTMAASTELTKAEREAKPQIKIGHYILKDTLGVGTFGKVKGTHEMVFDFLTFPSLSPSIRDQMYLFWFDFSLSRERVSSRAHNQL